VQELVKAGGSGRRAAEPEEARHATARGGADGMDKEERMKKRRGEEKRKKEKREKKGKKKRGRKKKKM
jgi:hypothetical protein